MEKFGIFVVTLKHVFLLSVCDITVLHIVDPPPQCSELGISCIWTPCWALLSVDVFTVFQPPMKMEHENDDNNTKPYIMLAPCGRRSRLGIWQFLSHVLLRLLLACAHLLVCVIFAVCIHVCTDLQEKWQVSADSRNERKSQNHRQNMLERDSQAVEQTALGEQRPVQSSPEHLSETPA